MAIITQFVQSLLCIAQVFYLFLYLVLYNYMEKVEKLEVLDKKAHLHHELILHAVCIKIEM